MLLPHLLLPAAWRWPPHFQLVTALGQIWLDLFSAAGSCSQLAAAAAAVVVVVVVVVSDAAQVHGLVLSRITHTSEA